MVNQPNLRLERDPLGSYTGGFPDLIKMLSQNILSSPKAFIMLGFAACFYLYEFLLRVAPAAMYNDLMLAFNVTATQFGLLSSFYFITYGLLQAPVGVWTDQFGPKRLLTIACFTCALGTFLFSQSSSLWLAELSRALIGAGSAFAFICCMKIASDWFKPQHFPLLAGLTLTLGNMGAVFGEGPVSVAITHINWRDFLQGIAIVGLLLAVVLWFTVQDQKNHNEKRPEFFKHFFALIRHPRNWWIGVYGFLTTAPTDAFGGLWAVPFLVDVHGFDRSTAASCASMTFIGVGLGSPFLSFLADKLKSRKKAMLLGAVGAMFALLYLIYTPVYSTVLDFVFMFLFGFFGSYVMTFVVMREQNTKHLAGTAAGFANMMSIIGSTSLQLLIGIMLDKLWSGKTLNGVPIYDQSVYSTALICLPISYLLAICLLPFIKETYSLVVRKESTDSFPNGVPSFDK